MKDPAIVFVYGTLKEGGQFAENFDNYRLKSFPATVYGSLYSVMDQFPALVLNEEEDLVFGEIHIYNHGTEVLKAMDLIEGCVVPTEEGSPENMFNRALTIATFLDDVDAELPVTVYTWNLESDNLVRINSGVWEL